MAKKVAKKSEAATATAIDASPAIDAAPAAAPAKTSKPRATSVPRAAKAAVVAAASEVVVTTDMIAERAYHMWRNGEPGDDVGHWLAAERELRNGR